MRFLYDLTNGPVVRNTNCSAQKGLGLLVILWIWIHGLFPSAFNFVGPQRQHLLRRPELLPSRYKLRFLMAPIGQRRHVSALCKDVGHVLDG